MKLEDEKEAGMRKRLEDREMSRDDFDAIVAKLPLLPGESRERGTLRYCAPEVARYERSGHSADVFSLGCCFLELLVVFESPHGLVELQKLRPANKGSYEVNLDKSYQWLSLIGLTKSGHEDGGFAEHGLDTLRLTIKQMLCPDRTKRLTAVALQLWLKSLEFYQAGKSPGKSCPGCDEWCKYDPIQTYQQLKNTKCEKQRLLRLCIQKNPSMHSIGRCTATLVTPVDLEQHSTSQGSSDRKLREKEQPGAPSPAALQPQYLPSNCSCDTPQPHTRGADCSAKAYACCISPTNAPIFHQPESIEGDSKFLSLNHGSLCGVWVTIAEKACLTAQKPVIRQQVLEKHNKN
ncbi:hypothetical protein BU25DRAFT_418842 [Macroventuria anomochaeta]|uniref:Uncharacterized protein n=1 Tax=Macroventuria anomochaeta TaxID=301207 RepID=A0ACB6SB78_9PLEO|nr:uncharacterized protein BU25DRAFT_418842 [Macroventuria anomochaeta]KAF2631232.1 hypothetical protein BU25DRAFT_418842 [Macroventuria anomochaeta]